MWKKLGFVVLVLGFAAILRPDLFFASKNEAPKEEEMLEAGTRNSGKVDDNYKDPRKPSLLAKDNGQTITQYADGYSEKDFGKAFKEPEDMFQSGAPQQSVGGLWDLFLELRFDLRYDESIDDVIMRPLFTKEIKKLNGTEIEIQGYIIPYDIVHSATSQKVSDGTMFMLSAYPAASCFFCKGAGPESVMEVFPKKPIPYSKNLVKIKGRLELNDFDFLRMAYILHDARLVN